VNEQADASDDEKHDDGELIDLQVEAGAESAGRDPGKIRLHPGNLLRRELGKFADGFEGKGKRKARRAKGDRVDDFVRPFAAEQAVDGRAQQGQERDDPEIVEYRH